MRPRNDVVLIRRIAPEAMSAGGLHIPDMAKEKRMRCVIEAIGPGAFLSYPGQIDQGVRCIEAMADLRVGQTVLLGKYGGVAVEGEPDLFLVREQEILMVVDEGGREKKR